VPDLSASTTGSRREGWCVAAPPGPERGRARAWVMRTQPAAQPAPGVLRPWPDALQIAQPRGLAARHGSSGARNRRRTAWPPGAMQAPQRASVRVRTSCVCSGSAAPVALMLLSQEQGDLRAPSHANWRLRCAASSRVTHQSACDVLGR